ncbi:MAG TPA: sigma 54-interacting transcriptional regulator, partial [Polyangiaceae bacterium]
MSASTPPVALSAAPPALKGGTDANAVHVLVIDDEPALRRSLARVLETRGMRVGVAEDGVRGLEYVQRTPPDVALVDMMMPGIGGLEVLARIKAMGAPCEVVLMTAFADVDSAVAAMKAGAYHFLTKPFHSNDAVAHIVLKGAEHRRLADRARELEQVLLSKERFGEIIGDSPRILEVFRLIAGVAPASSTILILGESGTGKELVARAIHQYSQRAKKAFVAVNCGAIPKELVESELFGHVRGAFTGAQTARAGLFETADGGSILLDEVGDLPLAAQ